VFVSEPTDVPGRSSPRSTPSSNGLRRPWSSGLGGELTRAHDDPRRWETAGGRPSPQWGERQGDADRRATADASRFAL